MEFLKPASDGLRMSVGKSLGETRRRQDERESAGQLLGEYDEGKPC
jgi:hypothetical protein